MSQKPLCKELRQIQTKVGLADVTLLHEQHQTEVRGCKVAVKKTDKKFVPNDVLSISLTS